MQNNFVKHLEEKKVWKRKMRSKRSTMIMRVIAKMRMRKRRPMGQLRRRSRILKSLDRRKSKTERKVPNTIGLSSSL